MRAGSGGDVFRRGRGSILVLRTIPAVLELREGTRVEDGVSLPFVESEGRYSRDLGLPPGISPSTESVMLPAPNDGVGEESR